MKRDIISLTILILLLLVFVFIEGLMQKNVVSDNLTVIASIPYWDQQRAMESFKKNVERIDLVSFFWYHLDESGNIEKYKYANEDVSAINFAKKHNVKTLMLVANLADDDTSEENWDSQRVERVILTEQARNKHIKALMALAEKKKFDGVLIDYEALKRNQRENFSLFIEELSVVLHKKEKILAVAIHPKTGEFKPEEDNGSHAQDLERIGRWADQLHFMTYLEHGFFSDPGPAGSIEWIERVMRYALTSGKVPREKAFLGAGLMGIEWHQKQDDSYQGINNDLQYEEVMAITRQFKIDPLWDDPSGKVVPLWDKKSETPHFVYYNGPERRLVWYEDQFSILEKLELTRDLGIAGVHFWRLGGEDPEIWNKIRKAK